MITQQAGGKEFKFWSSIDELPIERYMQFQSLMLQDAGIGSTLEDYDKHEEQTDAFLGAKRYDEAIKARENKRFNVYFILAKVNTKSLSLASLCYSVGGELRYDFSDDGLADTSRLINKAGYTQKQLIELVELLKKK